MKGQTRLRKIRQKYVSEVDISLFIPKYHLGPNSHTNRERERKSGKQKETLVALKQHTEARHIMNIYNTLFC